MSFVVSYAQNREDFLINAFFPDVKQGFYVDVGANHPLHDSVTKIFYSKGWHGINIEPVKSQYELLAQKRPRDINLCLGVGDKPGMLKLRSYNGPGLSTFSSNMKEAYQTAEAANPNAASYTDVEIEVKTLKQIFQDNAVEHVHFLKVDVEGFEYNVLQGMDWNKNRPELICIESNHIDKDWRPLLSNHDYQEVFFDGLNGYYLASEAHSRLKYFTYPEKLLVGPQIIKWTVKQEFDSQLRAVKADNRKLRTQLDALAAENIRLKNTNQSLATDQ